MDPAHWPNLLTGADSDGAPQAVTGAVVGLLIAIFILVALARLMRIVPVGHAGIVERFGTYRRTLGPGLGFVVPFIDRVRMIDIREQVLSPPSTPLITHDNQVILVEFVLYYQITDPRAATYEIGGIDRALEHLAVTALRNVVGDMDLERALTSREEINADVRSAVDETSRTWGVRANRVELKVVDSPRVRASVRRLQSPDADLETFQPADPWSVGIVVQVIAGPSDGPGEEAFDVVVCTPRWLERRVREGPLAGRHHLIVERYDLPQIREYLTTAVESAEAPSWQELADRLGQVGRREFEDSRS